MYCILLFIIDNHNDDENADGSDVNQSRALTEAKSALPIESKNLHKTDDDLNGSDNGTSGSALKENEMKDDDTKSIETGDDGE